MKTLITDNDFSGEHRKCDYVLAYFKAHNLNVGDKWSQQDYMRWITGKHREFHENYNLPPYVSYWTGHNEDLLEEFLKFIGYK